MNMIRAVFRDGHLIPVEPVDMADGTEWNVFAYPVGINPDEDRERTPEEIEREMAAADAVPTLELTDEEWAEIQRDRAEYRKLSREKAEVKIQRLMDIIEGRA